MDFKRVAEAIESGTKEIKQAAKAYLRASDEYLEVLSKVRPLKKAERQAEQEFIDSLKPKVKQAEPRKKPDPVIEEPSNEPT